MAPKPSPLEGFKRLSNTISVYEPLSPPPTNTPSASSSTPPTPSTNASKPPPSLIIICTWMGGATPRRISKYTQKYQLLLPAASILLIQATTPDMTYRTITTQLRNIIPARDYILSFLSKYQSQQSQNRNRNQNEETRNDRPILLHLLSSGGSNTSIILSWSLSDPLSPSPISLSHYLQAIIHDSTPGDQDFWRGYNSLAVAFTSSPLPTRIIGKSLSFASIAIMHPLMKTEVLKGMAYLRRMLLETFDDSEVKRLYLVSKGDEVVNWEAVLGHAGEAKAKGFQVKSVVFERGEHCALPVENGVRYWNEILGLWNRDSSGGGEVDSKKLVNEIPGTHESEDGLEKKTKSVDDIFESKIRSKL